MPELYFEDFTPFITFDLGSVEVTHDEILRFAGQFDPQPFHVDEKAAADSAFGGLIASGWHTCSLWMRMYVDGVLSRSDSRGSPGVEEVRWRAPVRPGDVLTASTTVLETRPSETDTTRGTVFTESAMTNQDGVIVMTMRGRGMFGKRPTPRPDSRRT